MSDLTARLVDLQSLRGVAALAAAKLKAAREQFDREHTPLIEFVRHTAASVETAETALKAVAAVEYERTKEKKLAPGIEIKIFKDYAIDEAAGLAWATEKQLCLIPAQLDVAAIKKLATVQKLPFIVVSEVPKVQIATDLSKVALPDSAAPATAVA